MKKISRTQPRSPLAECNNRFIEVYRLSNALGRWQTICGNMRLCEATVLLERLEQTEFVLILVGALFACPRTPDCSFTLTPQRMRMITQAFSETLELGLKKPDQIVVCAPSVMRYSWHITTVW